jgi:hypothetical protein
MFAVPINTIGLYNDEEAGTKISSSPMGTEGSFLGEKAVGV